jgi:hypothetical protein
MHDPIANPFHRIWVGNGGRLTDDFMKAFSITHILNCAEDNACPSNIKASLPENRYTCINAVDSVDVQLFKTWYPTFKDALDKYLKDPSCKGVYIHCQAGMNRSAFMAAAYVIKTFGVPLGVCVSQMVAQRPCVMTNTAFQSQLIDFVNT